MTNQLLLAQVLAEGAESAQSFTAIPWTTIISSAIGLLGSIIVAWWSGRKIDKQMELSKQATPPELTRYKTWVEVSEKYKELMEFERANSFEDTEKEYQEIRASRKAALERAVWERRVLSSCSDIVAQRRLLELSEGYIFTEKVNSIQVVPSFESKISIIFHFISYIIAIIFSVVFIFFLAKYFVIFSGHALNAEIDYLQVFLFIVFGFLLFFMSMMAIRLLYIVLDGFIDVLRGAKIAEHEYIKIVQIYAKKEVFAEVIKVASKAYKNASRVRYSFFDEKYSDMINLPAVWSSGVWYSSISKFLGFMAPYFVLEKFNKSKKPYGSYLEGAFEIDAKNLEGKELSAQGKAASDKEDKESAEAKAESKS